MSRQKNTTGRPKTRRNRPKRYVVFLGLQFTSELYSRSDVVALVEKATEIADQELKKRYPLVSLRVKHEFVQLGEAVSAQIVTLVKEAAAVIFELSEPNPNVYFELGLAFGFGNRHPALLYNKATEVPIASDVRDLFRLPYPKDGVDQVVGRLAQHIEKVLQARIDSDNRDDDQWSDVRRVWKGESAFNQVTIVCPELPKSYRPKYSRNASLEFVNLARYGDPDALVEVLSFLPKLLPNAQVKQLTCAELHPNDRAGNLIVIGGPDFNTVSRDLIKAVRLPFTCEETTKGTAFLDTEKGTQVCSESKSRMVTKDCGLFARFPNPWNEGRTVIMVCGLGTFGVLGAVKSFGMNKVGRANARTIKRITKSANPQFAALVPIPVISAQPTASRISVGSMYTYPWSSQ